METSKTKKMSVTLTLFAVALATTSLLFPESTYQNVMENHVIKALQKKLHAYTAHFPEDRVYLQTDKPFYEPGDDIWISAYIRNGADLKASDKSDIVSVELINPKGAVEKKINLIAKHGKAAGDFAIDKDAVGGIYKLRAYTQWMKNQGEDSYFTKELQVQEVILPNLKMKLDFSKKAFGPGDEVVASLELINNENKVVSGHPLRIAANLNGEKLLEKIETTDENGMARIKFPLPKKLNSNDGLLNVMIDYNGSTESISRSIPIVLNTIQFTAFPEGGDLVNGFESVVAFRAVNEFGKPADVEGSVVTEKGSKICSFSSYHQGMGAFKLVPQKGENYLIKITKPEGIQETFRLPEPLNRGYVMQVNNSQKGELNLAIHTSETEELALVAQVRGTIYYTTVITTQVGTNTLNISTEQFPAGVAQLTLFDSHGIARAERLSFVNRDKQMTISVQTDKEHYLPREKVKMTVMVKDERGMPMPANLSMAVVNDQLLSFADDKSGTIVSQLLLQHDLKENIEDPAFYFNTKESKSLKALDYVMMTSGWRRFTWEKIMEEELPVISYLGQKAIVSGKLLDVDSQKPIANVKIKTSTGGEYSADSNGQFSISKLDLTTPLTLSFHAEGYYPQTRYISDYNQNTEVFLYKTTHPYYSRNHVAHLDDMAMHVQSAPAVAANEMMIAEKAPHFKHKNNIDKKPETLAKRTEKENKMEEKREDRNQVVKEIAAGAPARNQRAKKMMFHEAEEDIVIHEPSQNLYYRARQFYAPVYEQQAPVETRSDFRNTIYWNPDIEIGYSGKKTIEFFTSDNISSFRATVEGISRNGMVGRTEKTFFTQLPFTISTKIPVETATEDLLSIPLTLKNNTGNPLGGELTIVTPPGLEQIGKTENVQTIMPGKAKTIYLDYKVLNKTGEGDFSVSFKSCGLSDAITQKIKIVPKGFPAQVSFSSQEKEKEYVFEIKNMVNGSLKASFTAFPNVVSDLMKGVEGILREPYGCFEQTSCTAYPNAMVLDYLKSTDSKDLKTLAHAGDLLDRGYKRLTSFETSGRGYEWFGANPAHEGLTAYGIMEFTDMKKAGQNIDEEMLNRTAHWLLNRRDGKGGFEREKRALHDFGRISDDILNAYIVYALAESGYTDITKEFDNSFNKAISSDDPYMLALMANAAYAMGQPAKGDNALKRLLSKQEKEGAFKGLTHSITYSQGNSLIIETTALSVMAILKSPVKDGAALNRAVHYLTGTRSGSGVFSSTQGTILSLKALTEFAKFSKKTSEDGTIIIYIDNKKVAEQDYKAGSKEAIVVEGLEHYIKGEGKHTLKIKYLNVKTPLPYSVALNWNTFLPASDPDCVIGISTRLAATSVQVGETVRLTTTVTNKKNESVPNTMAIIGIPAGFSAQAWQLKELQEKQVFDYYEIKGNTIAVYYRGMAAGSAKIIALDLKAEIPGSYDSPASSAYLYYTNELKTWSAAERIQIKKTGSL